MHFDHPVYGPKDVLLDEEDYERLKDYTWGLKSSGGSNVDTIVCFRNISKSQVKYNKFKSTRHFVQYQQLLQKDVLDVPLHYRAQIRKKNKNFLDCRKSNLVLLSKRCIA
jgi:hypothetical protein